MGAKGADMPVKGAMGHKRLRTTILDYRPSGKASDQMSHVYPLQTKLFGETGELERNARFFRLANIKIFSF